MYQVSGISGLWCPVADDRTIYAASKKTGYKFRMINSTLKILLRILSETLGKVLRMDL
jgi:hypothetical protein